MSASLCIGFSIAGPSPRDEIEADAERLERQQQIGKENRGVDFDPADRLQRHLGREVGRTTQVEQRVALAQRAVFAHVAAGLTHEPDGSRVDGLAAARFEEAAIRIGQLVALSRLRARPTRSSSHIGLNSHLGAKLAEAHSRRASSRK